MSTQLASLAISAFIAALFSVMPLLRRDNIFFGYHVSREWSCSGPARRIVRNYRLQIAGWMLLVCGLTAYGFGNTGPLVITAGAIAAFTLVHRATRPYAVEPPTLRSASLLPDRSGLPGCLAAMLAPLAILASAAAWLHFHWDRIPQSFPVHFDLNGNPNRWSSRTPAGVYGPLLIGAVSVGLMLVLAVAVLKGSRRGNAGAARFRLANLRALTGLAWLLSGLFSWITLSPALSFRVPPGVIFGTFILATAALLVPVIAAASTRGAETDDTPDAAWKLGMFYYNPADPAFMVQRRFGIGYTLNFGNRRAWPVIALVGCLPVILLAIQKAM